MAFTDITKVLYEGKVKLDYKDKAHRYYVRLREDWKLKSDDPKAWGKIMYPKGTTTLIGDTLEKKGLMQWPKGLALRELFGFYDFTNENGEKMTGFSKGVGTMWDLFPTIESLSETGAVDISLQKTYLPIIKSAADAWLRKQKKGADIGSVVHAAIEAHIKGAAYDIEEQYLWTIKESEFETEELRDKAMQEMPLEVEMANLAFNRFKDWWKEASPTLYSAEDLLYSLEHNVCGTYDADFEMDRKHHPVFKLPTEEVSSVFVDQYLAVKAKDSVRITADWKTSNASASKEAAAPEGVYYSYFVQLGLYELMRREMGMEPADDLLTVSARKDGAFSLVYASELGLTVDDCIDWAKCVITCYRFAEKTKAGLLAHAAPKMSAKEAF